MTLSHEAPVTALSVNQVSAEALRRVAAAREAALVAGREDLAVELAEFAEEFDPQNSTWDLQGADWALPYVLAALLGVTVSEV
jgi:hypothetical protein